MQSAEAIQQVTEVTEERTPPRFFEQVRSPAFFQESPKAENAELRAVGTENPEKDGAKKSADGRPPLPPDAGIPGNMRALGGFGGNSKFEISDFKSPISDFRPLTCDF